MGPYELPLSWSWGPAGSDLVLRPLALRTGGQFLHAVQVPEGLSLAALRAALAAAAQDAPLLAQGLSGAQLEALGAAEGPMLLGSSARLELEGYRPPHKVRNLARRASDVQVEERVPRDAGPLQDALEHAAHGGIATLRYVFRARVEDADRAFVVQAGGEVRGMVSLTANGAGAWHVELLIRHPEAPDGAMERLIAEVIEALQREGQARIDLGQVAFHVEEPAPAELTTLNRALLAGVPAAVAATGGRFNFEGLRRFKNKFGATWIPRYFAGWPRLRKRDLRSAVDAAELGQFVRFG